MFKELLAAKRKYYGEKNWYPEAVLMSTETWKDIKMEGKALSMSASHGFSIYADVNAVGSVNGMLVYLDDSIKGFKFGFSCKEGFTEEVF